MNELVTVIVPVYNREKYLSCCVSSILGQSYRNLEILLVDNGSTDESAALCEEWCKRDGRIRFLHLENAGVSAARNAGLEAAKGEYIAFVDADDWILPGMLERQMKCLEEEGSDMVMCGFREVREADRAFFSGHLSGQTALQEEEGRPVCVTVNREEYVSEYLLTGNTHCWSILFVQRILEGVRFREDLTIGEDLVFLVDCLPSLRHITVMENREYCYYINETGAMYASFCPSYMDQIRCWKITEKKLVRLYPSCTVQLMICLFQAILLVAGKLAVLSGTQSNGNQDKEVSRKISSEIYLRECHEEAKTAWKRLGKEGRRMLPVGYRIKGPVFLYAPGAYLKLYHVWKGRK